MSLLAAGRQPASRRKGTGIVVEIAVASPNRQAVWVLRCPYGKADDETLTTSFPASLSLRVLVGGVHRVIRQSRVVLERMGVSKFGWAMKNVIKLDGER